MENLESERDIFLRDLADNGNLNVKLFNNLARSGIFTLKHMALKNEKELLKSGALTKHSLEIIRQLLHDNNLDFVKENTTNEEITIQLRQIKITKETPLRKVVSGAFMENTYGKKGYYITIGNFIDDIHNNAKYSDYGFVRELEKYLTDNWLSFNDEEKSKIENLETENNTLLTRISEKEDLIKKYEELIAKNQELKTQEETLDNKMDSLLEQLNEIQTKGNKPNGPTRK